MPVGDLSKLRQSLAQDVELITGSYGNLKVAQSRYALAQQAAQELTKEPKDEESEVMVPLTGSLYVPGKLSSSSPLLCDIGTGYFVEKSSDDAQEFCAKKLVMIQKNLDQVGQSLQIKRRDLEMVTLVLQNKMQQIKQQQQAQIDKVNQLQ